jgi:hypothetical protein
MAHDQLMATLYPQLLRLTRCVHSTTLSEEFQAVQDRLDLDLYLVARARLGTVKFGLLHQNVTCGTAA